MENPMRTANRIPPALKHGAYSATAVLPGESRAAFEKLHRGLIAEYTPSGVTEDDIVADMARLMWRKQNLGTLRIAEFAQGEWSATVEIGNPIASPPLFWEVSEEDKEKAKQEMLVAQDRLRKELGDTFEFIEIGGAATFDGLTEELETKERLDALIEKCLKRLLLVRGLKSVSTAPSSAPPQRVLGPPKAA
jgi:hypothetical protein